MAHIFKPIRSENRCALMPYLVPEKEIGLTELKLLYVKFLHEGKSHDVEAREDPTSP